MAIKAFKSGFLVIIALFAGLIWFLNSQGAIKLTFFPAHQNVAEKIAEKSAKTWVVELSDGTKWGYE